MNRSGHVPRGCRSLVMVTSMVCMFTLSLLADADFFQVLATKVAVSEIVTEKSEESTLTETESTLDIQDKKFDSGELGGVDEQGGRAIMCIGYAKEAISGDLDPKSTTKGKLLLMASDAIGAAADIAGCFKPPVGTIVSFGLSVASGLLGAFGAEEEAAAQAKAAELAAEKQRNMTIDAINKVTTEEHDKTRMIGKKIIMEMNSRTRRAIMAISKEVGQSIQQSMNLQYEVIDKLESLSDEVGKVHTNIKKEERMMYDKKMGIPDIRQVLYTFKEIQERYAAIGEYQEEQDSQLQYEDYISYLENDVGEYITHADEELSFIHAILDPVQLSNHIDWYFKNIGYDYKKQNDEFKAAKAAQEIYGLYQVASQQLHFINAIAAVRNTQGFNLYMVEVLESMTTNQKQYNEMYAGKFAPGSCKAVIGSEIQATWLDQCSAMGYKSLEKCCDENIKCMVLNAAKGKNGMCNALKVQQGNCYAISSSSTRDSFLSGAFKSRGGNLGFEVLKDPFEVEKNLDYQFRALQTNATGPENVFEFHQVTKPSKSSLAEIKNKATTVIALDAKSVKSTAPHKRYPDKILEGGAFIPVRTPKNEWWSVGFQGGEPTYVHKVTMHARWNCCGDRMQSVKVWVGDNDSNYKLCNEIPRDAKIKNHEEITVECKDKSIKGTRVKLTSGHRGYLNFNGPFKVEGIKVPPPPEGAKFLAVDKKPTKFHHWQDYIDSIKKGIQVRPPPHRTDRGPGGGGGHPGMPGSNMGPPGPYVNRQRLMYGYGQISSNTTVPSNQTETVDQTEQEELNDKSMQDPEPEEKQQATNEAAVASNSTDTETPDDDTPTDENSTEPTTEESAIEKEEEKEVLVQLDENVQMSEEYHPGMGYGGGPPGGPPGYGGGYGGYRPPYRPPPSRPKVVPQPPPPKPKPKPPPPPPPKRHPPPMPYGPHMPNPSAYPFARPPPIPVQAKPKPKPSPPKPSPPPPSPHPSRRPNPPSYPHQGPGMTGYGMPPTPPYRPPQVSGQGNNPPSESSESEDDEPPKPDRAARVSKILDKYKEMVSLNRVSLVKAQPDEKTDVMDKEFGFFLKKSNLVYYYQEDRDLNQIRNDMFNPKDKAPETYDQWFKGQTYMIQHFESELFLGMANKQLATIPKKMFGEVFSNDDDNMATLSRKWLHFQFYAIPCPED